MKYRYNIKHKVDGKVVTINFKNKTSMIGYLNKNKDKLNKLDSPAIHFDKIVLPLKQTVWYVKQLTELQQQRLDEQKRQADFVSRLEK